jgi:uncharacterized membrane protein YsdA (DUF1294 family)
MPRIDRRDVNVMTLLYLSFVNMLCFAAFGVDKGSARSGRRRVPERTLLLLAFAGGSGGALLASNVFHHKTRKQPFRNRLLAIAGLHVLAFMLFAGHFLTAW